MKKNRKTSTYLILTVLFCLSLLFGVTAMHSPAKSAFAAAEQNSLSKTMHIVSKDSDYVLLATAVPASAVNGEDDYVMGYTVNGVNHDVAVLYRTIVLISGDGSVEYAPKDIFGDGFEEGYLLLVDEFAYTPGATFDFNAYFTNVTQNVSYSATSYSNESFTVSFNTNGGTEIADQSVYKYASAVKPSNPKKTGYDFVKWQLNGKDYEFPSAITSSITLDAVWELKDYTKYTINSVSNTDIDARYAGETINVALPSKFNGAQVIYSKIGDNFVNAEIIGGNAVINVSDLPLGESSCIIFTYKNGVYASASVAFTKATAILTTKADLNALSALSSDADMRENYWGGYFILGSDIDMGGAALTTVAAYRSGNDGKGFVGTFDGRGHSISNFTLGYWGYGLFGGLGSGSVVKNVSFINVAHPGYTALLGISNGTVNISNVYVHYKSVNYPGTDDVTGMLLGTVWGDSSIKNVIVDLSETGIDFGDKSGADALVFNNKVDCFTDCYVVGAGNIKMSYQNTGFTTGRYATMDAFIAANVSFAGFDADTFGIVDGVPAFVQTYLDKKYEYAPTYSVANTDIDARREQTVTLDLPSGVKNYSLKWAHYNGAAVEGVSVNSDSTEATITVSALPTGESSVTLLFVNNNDRKSVKYDFTKATAIIKTVSDWNEICGTGGLSYAADERTNYYGGYFILGSDVQCDGVALNSIAGFNSTDKEGGFVGTIDGRGYTIDNFTFGYYGWGLIGGIEDGSVIKNISFTNVAHPGYTSLLGIRGGIVDISNVYVQYKSIVYPGDSDCTGLLLGLYRDSSIRNVVIDVSRAGFDFSGKANAFVWGYNARPSSYSNCYFIGSSSAKLFYNNTSYTTGRYASWNAFVAANNDLSSFAAKYWDKIDGKVIGNSAQKYIVDYTEHLSENVLHNVSVTDGNEYLVRNGATEYKIVVRSKYTTTAYSGFEYLQNYLGYAGGCTFKTVKESKATWSADAKYIVFGCESLFEAAGLTMPEQDLGTHGYYIKTVGKSVFIMGEDTGLRNGALEFLHHAIGFEPYSSDTIVYDKANNIRLPVFDIADKPDMELLYLSGGQTKGEISVLYRSIEDPSVPINGNTVHNSFCYLPKGTYQSSHAKWYAYNVEQLCYTAHGDSQELAAMQDTLFENLKTYLNAYPNQTLVTITQEDSDNWCNCSTCRASKTKYGTDAAVVVKFCNAIARKLDAYLTEQAQASGKAKRQVDLIFFAYLKTASAPVKVVNGEYVPIDNDVVCDDNVGVYYAPIRASFTESLYSDVNATYRKDLEAWSALTDNVYVWFYETNFTDYLYPYSTFDSFMESYRCLKTNHAKFIMPQGVFDSQASTGFNVLKDYLNSKAAWNVNVSTKELIDGFFDNYFMDASVPMRKYFDEMRAYYKYLRQTNSSVVTGGIYDDIDRTSLWPKAMLERWLSYIDSAYSAIEKYSEADTELYEKLFNHIKLESMAIRYMLLDLYSSSYSSSDLNKMRAAFVADANALGITRVSENKDFSELFSSW